MPQLIVAGEQCRANAAGVPSELLAAVVPSLVTLACSAPEPHSASAATCLAAGMTGRCADAWRLHLGNLQVLTERCASRARAHHCEAATPRSKAPPPAEAGTDACQVEPSQSCGHCTKKGMGCKPVPRMCAT